MLIISSDLEKICLESFFWKELGGTNMSNAFQFSYYTAVTFWEEKTREVYDKERQYGYHVLDAWAQWQHFKLFEMRRHGAYRI